MAESLGEARAAESGVVAGEVTGDGGGGGAEAGTVGVGADGVGAGGTARSATTGDGVLETLPAGLLARRLFPVRDLTDAETTAVRYGQRIEASGLTDDGAAGASDGESSGASSGALSRVAAADTDAGGSGGSGVVAAFAPAGHLVALLSDERRKARPVLVLDPA
ncbi:hypothetical protein ACPYO6_00800 [Georgenia sp. Z1344]|uniref:hypothetical protein n=1 Tax=Georgenia sp. Z1344 TaxID=3416706 RepID=UPI003CF02C6D